VSFPKSELSKSELPHKSELSLVRCHLSVGELSKKWAFEKWASSQKWAFTCPMSLVVETRLKEQTESIRPRTRTWLVLRPSA